LQVVLWLSEADFDRAKDVEVDVALGVGHDDAAVGEDVVDGEAELAFDFELTGLAEVEPDAELEEESVGAEVSEDDLGGGVAEDLGMLGGGVLKEALDLAGG